MEEEKRVSREFNNEDDNKEVYKFEFKEELKKDKSNSSKVNLAELTEVREMARNSYNILTEGMLAVNERIEILNTVFSSLIPKINQSLITMSEAIISSLGSIDLESINQAQEEHAKETEEVLKKYEANFWCLDMIMFCDIEDQELTMDKIPQYVEENLQSYIEEIITDPIYELHATLITEAYEAYKAGFYKLCVFPLFATFEYVITSWYGGNIKEDKVSIKQTKKVKYLYDKIKPEKYTNADEDIMFKVFALSVLRMFKKTFKTQKKPRPELHRHTIAHGFHDYDSLTKTDILKLFQLLKAAMILQFFDVHRVNIKQVAES